MAKLPLLILCAHVIIQPPVYSLHIRQKVKSDFGNMSYHLFYSKWTSTVGRNQSDCNLNVFESSDMIYRGKFICTGSHMAPFI